MHPLIQPLEPRALFSAPHAALPAPIAPIATAPADHAPLAAATLPNLQHSAWTVTYHDSTGNHVYKLEITRQQASRLTGTFGPYPVTGTIASASNIKLTITENLGVVSVSARLLPNGKLAGTWAWCSTDGYRESGSFTTRVTPF